jgi:hypothetical protein
VKPGPSISPRQRLLEVGGQLEQHVLAGRARAELDADRQA